MEYQPLPYTWCGPVAAANSLWWLDSKFHPNDLITPYGPWGDHDPQNVAGLTIELAQLMQTDVNGPGTHWMDFYTGLNSYLMYKGVDSDFEVHFMEYPEIFWIEDEVYRCQDVVLLLEFYDLSWNPIWELNPEIPGGQHGHYVTCAGIDSALPELLISDPYFDAFENGWTPGQSPIPHPPGHGPYDHDDAALVSHDAYLVSPVAGGPYPGAWELVNYLAPLGYPPDFHAVIRVAIATSPIELIIDKDTSTPLVKQGGQATYTITVENPSQVTKTGIEIWDPLPSELSYEGADFIGEWGGVTRTAVVDPVSGDATPTWGNWDIPPGGKVVIVYRVRVDPLAGTDRPNNPPTIIPPLTIDNDAYCTGAEDLGSIAYDGSGNDPEMDEDITVEYHRGDMDLDGDVDFDDIVSFIWSYQEYDLRIAIP